MAFRLLPWQATIVGSKGASRFDGRCLARHSHAPGSTSPAKHAASRNNGTQVASSTRPRARTEPLLTPGLSCPENNTQWRASTRVERNGPGHRVDASTHHAHEVAQIRLGMIASKRVSSHEATFWPGAFTGDCLRSQKPHGLMRNKAVMHDAREEIMLQCKCGKLLQLNAVIKVHQIKKQTNLGNLNPILNLSKELARLALSRTVVSRMAKSRSANSR